MPENQPGILQFLVRGDQAAVAAINKIATSIIGLRGSLQTVGIPPETKRSIESMEKAMSTLGAEIRATAHEAVLLNAVLGGIGSVIVGSFNAGVGVIKTLLSFMVDQTQAIIATSSQFEKLRISLKAVFKEAGEADRVFKFMEKFAIDTQFTLQQVVALGSSLKAVGIDPRLKVEGKSILSDISDLAGSAGRSLEEASFAFKDFVSVGATQSLRGVFSVTKEQIATTLREIGQKADFSTLHGRLEALSKFIREKFGGGSKLMAESFEGIMAGFSDELQTFQDRIGRAGFFDAVKKPLSALYDYIKLLFDAGIIDKWAKEISGILTGVVNQVRGGIEALFKGVDPTKSLKENIVAVWENIKDGFVTVWSALGTWWKTNYKTLFGFAEDFWLALSRRFTIAVASGIEMGMNAVQKALGTGNIEKITKGQIESGGAIESIASGKNSVLDYLGLGAASITSEAAGGIGDFAKKIRMILENEIAGPQGPKIAPQIDNSAIASITEKLKKMAADIAATTAQASDTFKEKWTQAFEAAQNKLSNFTRQAKSYIGGLSSAFGEIGKHEDKLQKLKEIGERLFGGKKKGEEEQVHLKALLSEAKSASDRGDKARAAQKYEEYAEEKSRRIFTLEEKRDELIQRRQDSRGIGGARERTQIDRELQKVLKDLATERQGLPEIKKALEASKSYEQSMLDLAKTEATALKAKLDEVAQKIVEALQGGKAAEIQGKIEEQEKKRAEGLQKIADASSAFGEELSKFPDLFAAVSQQFDEANKAISDLSVEARKGVELPKGLPELSSALQQIAERITAEDFDKQSLRDFLEKGIKITVDSNVKIDDGKKITEVKTTKEQIWNGVISGDLVAGSAFAY